MRILFFLCCILVPASLFSQQTEKPWSLQQCIDFALKNNIQIKQNMLNQKISEATHLQNKAQLFPDLNGNASHYYNNGKKIDPFTNSYITGDWSFSQNFSISSSITLFGGFQTLHSIRQSKYDLLSAQQDVLKMQNDISLNIASAYLQILFAQELLDVARSQSEITKLQADRTRKLVEVGNLPKGSLYDMEAQLAGEEVTIVNAENNLSLSLLNLTQMLNIDTVKDFLIAQPEIALPAEIILNTTSGQIYGVALTRQPEIKSAEFKLKSSEKGVPIAQSGMYPRLSLSSSYGTGYSSVSQYTATPSFSDQLDQNLNRSVGFNLSVPLFNNLQTYTAITRAKISRENAALVLQLQKDNLRKNIQQAFNDAGASLKKFQASKKAVHAMEESFNYMDQKYSVGAVTATDFNDAKNKLTKARSDLLQAKYDYVFKLKVLDFYQGKPITL